MSTFIKTSGHYESYNNTGLNDFKSFDMVYDGDIALTKLTDNDDTYFSLLNNDQIGDIIDNVTNIFKIPNNKQPLSVRLLKEFPINKKTITPLTKLKSIRTTNKSRPSSRTTRKKKHHVNSIDKTIY